MRIAQAACTDQCPRAAAQDWEGHVVEGNGDQDWLLEEGKTPTFIAVPLRRRPAVAAASARRATRRPRRHARRVPALFFPRHQGHERRDA